MRSNAVFGMECALGIFFVTLVTELVAYITIRLRRLCRDDTIGDVQKHLASKGLTWSAKWLAYVDTYGRPATGEVLREAMKDFD
jgi:hypothetical protein